MNNDCGLGIGQIIQVVTKVTGFTVAELKGDARDTATVRARQLAMWFLRTRLGLSTSTIGIVLGGRDHTTVMHGLKVIPSKCERDPATAELLQTIELELICLQEKRAA